MLTCSVLTCSVLTCSVDVFCANMNLTTSPLGQSLSVEQYSPCPICMKNELSSISISKFNIRRDLSNKKGSVSVSKRSE